MLSGVHGVDRFTAYQNAAKALVMRLLACEQARFIRPKLLVLHASNRERSNTLALGTEVQKRLAPSMEIREIAMTHDALYDCNGCGYTACVHYAEQESCFYGGLLPETVFPAICDADALLLLCPNYNDAPGAHFGALVNRLNALLLRGAPLEKDVYAVIVSGYSGSDIIAQQVLGALCLNKTFALPPRFCLMQTANNPGEAMQAEGMPERIDEFAARMLRNLKQEP